METQVKRRKRIKVEEPVRVSESNRPQIKKRITLRELISSNSEIWVMNRSAEYTKKTACNVAFQVGHGDMVDMVIIPPGNDPICITDQVDPESLKSCRDLFKLVKSGALELLDPKGADEYYAHNVGRKKIVEEKVNAMLNPNKDRTNKRDFDLNRPDPDRIKKGIESAARMHPKVSDVCLKARHGAITEGAAMEAVMEQERVLTAVDFQYLSTNGVFNKVKLWAKQNLERMAESE